MDTHLFQLWEQLIKENPKNKIFRNTVEENVLRRIQGSRGFVACWNSSRIGTKRKTELDSVFDDFDLSFTSSSSSSDDSKNNISPYYFVCKKKQDSLINEIPEEDFHFGKVKEDEILTTLCLLDNNKKKVQHILVNSNM